jgi:hypothetical protein
MSYSEYQIPFNNVPIYTPTRKIKLRCIGAGLSGITLAYKTIHELKLQDVVDFTIYERQARQTFSTDTSPTNESSVTWEAPGLLTDIPD